MKILIDEVKFQWITLSIWFITLWLIFSEYSLPLMKETLFYIFDGFLWSIAILAPLYWICSKYEFYCPNCTKSLTDGSKRRRKQDD